MPCLSALNLNLLKREFLFLLFSSSTYLVGTAQIVIQHVVYTALFVLNHLKPISLARKESKVSDYLLLR